MTTAPLPSAGDIFRVKFPLRDHTVKCGQTLVILDDVRFEHIVIHYAIPETGIVGMIGFGGGLIGHAVYDTWQRKHLLRIT